METETHTATISTGPVAGILLKAYKISLSPVFAAFGARCRHLPSCSEYAAGAVTQHGVWPGGWMALARLCRCHPFGSSGHDPVPASPENAHPLLPWRYGDWAWTVRPFPETEPESEDKD